MASFTAGDQIECFVNQVILHKIPVLDDLGNPVLSDDGRPMFKSGFKIAGGIDQDNTKSPQGYPDKGIYVTHVYEGSPAHLAGLKEHDKILQVNGHDMTMVTHKKAVDYISRKPVLEMFVYRPSNDIKGDGNDINQTLHQQQPSTKDLQLNYDKSIDRLPNDLDKMKITNRGGQAAGNFDLQKYVHQQQQLHQQQQSQQQFHHQQQQQQQQNQQHQQYQQMQSQQQQHYQPQQQQQPRFNTTAQSTTLNTANNYPPQQFPQKLISQQRNMDNQQRTMDNQQMRFELQKQQQDQLLQRSPPDMKQPQNIQQQQQFNYNNNNISSSNINNTNRDFQLHQQLQHQKQQQFGNNQVISNQTGNVYNNNSNNISNTNGNNDINDSSSHQFFNKSQLQYQQQQQLQPQYQQQQYQQMNNSGFNNSNQPNFHNSNLSSRRN